MFPSIFDTLEEVLDGPPPDPWGGYWEMLAELEAADEAGLGDVWWNERIEE